MNIMASIEGLCLLKWVNSESFQIIYFKPEIPFKFPEVKAKINPSCGGYEEEVFCLTINASFRKLWPTMDKLTCMLMVRRGPAFKHKGRVKPWAWITVKSRWKINPTAFRAFREHFISQETLWHLTKQGQK